MPETQPESDQDQEPHPADLANRESRAKRSIIQIAAICTVLILAIFLVMICVPISYPSSGSLLTGLCAVAVAAIVVAAEVRMRKIEDQTWDARSKSNRDS